MRIALIPDEFLPDGTRAHSKMIYELACELKNLGHVAIVITPGTPNQARILQIDYIDDIEVWRFRSGYTRGVGMVRRGINEFLLSFRAWFAIRKMVKANKIDLCVNYSPTIFFGPLAWKLRNQGAYVYLVLRDMFPQWVIDQGLIKESSFAAHFFRLFEKVNYTTAHCIGLQSKANLDLFSVKFPTFKNIEILMNWTITDHFGEDKDDGSLRESLGIGNKVLFFYGGNIGHAQDMSNIMRLAKNLRDIHQAHFLILGEGDEYGLIKNLKAEWVLDNVTILPSVPQAEFESILAASDIGLFSLAREHSAHNFPGKILGYLRAGKPVLGSVNAGNDLLHVINDSNSGFVFLNGEDCLLETAAKKLVESAQLRKNTGDNGAILLQQKFCVESAAQIILSSMDRR
jgi:glycosyltransferase involved in cell wall biosynthesis